MSTISRAQLEAMAEEATVDCYDEDEALSGWHAMFEEHLAEPFTFVVDQAGALRLAPRRREHVVCATGGAVLGAGEISFHGASERWAVDEVSNQSTGYCQDVSSWPTVAEAEVYARGVSKSW